jgi:hypothetical protein
MRDTYYKILTKFGIQDTLSEIQNLSYSRKTSILLLLLNYYDASIVNMALNDYKVRYINIHRVDLHIIQKILTGLCTKYKNKLFKKLTK